MSFYDRRTSGLLSRVREDVSSLRDNVGDLFHHTARHSIPNGIKDLADEASDRLASGRSYAASRLRSLRGRQSMPALEVLGGALLLGAIAAGVYAFVRCHRSSLTAEQELEEELDPELL